MALRCLLFSSDEESSASIRQVLAGLGVEGEHCTDAVSAVERVTQQSYQIVIIDWDQQPEAGLLLSSARDKKATERPLTLAVVSDDASVPKALQAGANSILRKPVMLGQMKDTLTTARDLLRAKETAAAQAQAAAAGVAAGSAVPTPSGEEKTLRAGDFLHSASSTPGGQVVVESGAPELTEPATEPIDPLSELEPMAAAVAPPVPTPPLPSISSNEPRGLEWYLKRAGVTPGAAAPARAPEPPAPSKTELLGYDQTPSQSASEPPRDEQPTEHEQKTEAKLFAYIEGEGESEEKTRRQFRLGKGPILAALALAASAVVAAPQAPWHGGVKTLWARGQKSLHLWLNPQPVTTPQAPESHENFGRAGDEYKLPVAETIPDATTDPNQIRVVPVIDPTAKKNNNAGNADPNAAPADASTTTATDPASQPPAGQVQENQSSPETGQPSGAPAGGPAQPATQPSSSVTTASVTTPSGTMPSATTAAPSPEPTHVPAPAVPSSLLAPPPADTTHATNPQLVPLSNSDASSSSKVPSSLKSQMTSSTPEMSGNKAPEAALPSIEPVVVSEAAERALLAAQPAIAYPPSAKAQQGTVVLQVLIGRDGTVQGAKFLQGSLAFARAAIDGVKQWIFKPYIMNGRPVSVQTSLTMTFKPGQ